LALGPMLHPQGLPGAVPGITAAGPALRPETRGEAGAADAP
jgi:hypothetical protein